MNLELPSYLISYIKPKADALGISQQAFIKMVLRKMKEQEESK